MTNMTIVIPVQTDLGATELYDIILENLPDLIHAVTNEDSFTKIDEDEMYVKIDEVSDE
tara:strand:- start:295 stop:471 length:177 start_codon:yes stop_codon:yes gene_type:complete